MGRARFPAAEPETTSAALLGVVAVALLAGFLNAPLGFHPRAIYVGFLTNFGLMALGGLAVLNPPQGALLNRLTPLMLLAYLAIPIFNWRLGTTTAAGVALAWGAVPLLVYCILRGVAADQGSFLVRLLEWPPLRGLGRVSYGFYVYHAMFKLEMLERFTGPLHFSPAVAFVVEFTFAIGLTLVSWHLMEKPLLRLRDQLRSKRQPEETSLASTAAHTGSAP